MVEDIHKCPKNYKIDIYLYVMSIYNIKKPKFIQDSSGKMLNKEKNQLNLKEVLLIKKYKKLFKLNKKYEIKITKLLW